MFLQKLIPFILYTADIWPKAVATRKCRHLPPAKLLDTFEMNPETFPLSSPYTRFITGSTPLRVIFMDQDDCIKKDRLLICPEIWILSHLAFHFSSKLRPQLSVVLAQQPFFSRLQVAIAFLVEITQKFLLIAISRDSSLFSQYQVFHRYVSISDLHVSQCAQ